MWTQSFHTKISNSLQVLMIILIGILFQVRKYEDD